MAEEYNGLFCQESLEFLRDIVGPAYAKKEKEEFLSNVISIIRNFEELKAKFITSKGNVRSEYEELMFLR